MKIQKLEVFPGKEGNIREGEATNDYSEGRLIIYQNNISEEYKFPFGNARFLKIEDITCSGLKKQSILLLGIHPLVWDTVAHYSLGNWPPCKEYCSEIKEFSEMSQDDLDYYARYSDKCLEDIGKTIREGLSNENFELFSYKRLENLVCKKIISGMKQKYKGLCDLIERTDFEIQYDKTPLEYIDLGMGKSREFRGSHLTISSEKLYESEVNIHK